MLVVDRLTLKEDWQRAIVVRDLENDEAVLALLERDPISLPIRDKWSKLGGDDWLDRSMCISHLANLLYAPEMAYADSRERRLMAEWPAQADECKRLLRREIAIQRRALTEYDAAR